MVKLRKSSRPERSKTAEPLATRSPKARRRIRKAKRLEQARLWLLRGVVAGGVSSFERWHEDRDFTDVARLPELLGHSCEPPDGYDVGKHKAWTRQTLREIEEAISEAVGERTDPVFARIEELCACLDFDEVERDLLGLASLRVLNTAIAGMLTHSPEEIPTACRWLSRVVGHPNLRVREAISPRGALMSLGLLENNGPRYAVRNLLEPDDDFCEALMCSGPIIDSFFKLAKPAVLETGNYPHLEKEIRLASRYLQRAVDERLKGANVLLHGPPGTGKTELARLLAASLVGTAYEVAVADDHGESQDGRERLQAYLVCQRAFGKTGGAVMIFDEAEDVFPVQHHPFFGLVRQQTTEKGWLCRTLEENALPAIWIANTVGHIDPAMLRRFDVVIEVPIPPIEVRRSVVRMHVGALEIESSLVDELAACEDVSPSDVQRAVHVAKLATDGDPATTSDTVRSVLESSLSVRGQRFAVDKNAGGYAAYDLSLVRASCDLEHLVGSLGKAPVGTLCLYGPPGTGKTAFVKHAAEQLGFEVALHRGSDLLSKWVGETEARIARMFRDARPGRDLLFLDEADSFLRRRNLARASWEVTQVNELLTQMESFEGLFVCATNLLDDLDEAAFRRFGLKIRFDQLDAERRFRFACTELAAIGVPLPEAELADFRRRMDALDHLSLGDFAAVRKRFRLVAPPETAAAYAEALAEERGFKRSVDERRVGFGR